MNRLTSALAVGALTVGLIGAADVATAQSWYSRSAPLRAYEDGVTQGAAYGKFYNSNGAYARSKSVRRDARPGGNGVYVQTDFSFYSKIGVQRTPQWNVDRVAKTSRSTSGNWVTTTSSHALNQKWSSVRGGMKVCEDQSWNPDECSTVVIRSFGY